MGLTLLISGFKRDLHNRSGMAKSFPGIKELLTMLSSIRK